MSPIPGSNNVSAFSIDSSTGKLTQVSGSPFGSGSTPVFAVVDATGKFLFVGNQSSTNIYEYSIDSATGALTAVSGSPYGTGSAPTSMFTIE
jgi:6-phosphogluconolactonase (cycloisomerase 2 family)